MPDVSTLTINNGIAMPALGFGVFQTPPDQTRAAVAAALDAGYRHIDTAAEYGNERQVGEAVHASGVDRSEVFLETKIWISDYGYNNTLHGFEKSARKLGVDLECVPDLDAAAFRSFPWGKGSMLDELYALAAAGR